MVSDRASALVKLGKPSYLNVVSMPDLFHFSQDIAKAIGCRIGLKKSQLQAKWSEFGTSDTAEQKAVLETQLEQVTQYQKAYREQIEQVNKTVHPFNAQDEWQQEGQVEKGLSHCFTKIGRIAHALKMDVALDKASKILNQIPDIAAGVQTWTEGISKEIQEWMLVKAIPVPASTMV